MNEVLESPGTGEPGAETQGGPGTEIDPITLSVVLSRFDSIGTEMALTLERSAVTPILSVCHDFSCAIYDAVPRQLSIADSLPIHTTSMQLVLDEISRTFEGDVHDGDVFICNDPYRYNTHIGDVVTAAPVFIEGEHMFWSVTKGHQNDIGAMNPSSLSATPQNVWQEGLTIPPLRMIDAGKPRRDVIDLYLSNLRYRDLLEGDLKAQLGSIEKGRQRLVELCQEYGKEEISACTNAIIDYADRRMAQELEAMPDGTYTAEGWIDSDGLDTLDIPIKVSVTIDGDQARVDYTGSGPQARGGVNGSFAVAVAAGAVPFLYYVAPDIPRIQGCIDHISVTAPEGTIVNAKYPASTSCATIVPGDALSDVINKAMAKTMPDRVLAGTARAASTPQIAGEDDGTGAAWGTMVFNCTGGRGASARSDGWPMFQSHASFGAIKAQPIEHIEMMYPVRIDQWEIEPDSMGFGRHQGGAGTRFAIQPLLGDIDVITFGDGSRNPPCGLLGGTPGIGGGWYAEHHETGRRRYVSATGHIKVSTDEVCVSVSTGGGGHGDPLERDPSLVARDARDGIITHEAATNIYGVVYSEETFEVDEDATASRRKSLKKSELPVVLPETAGAGTWAEDRMRSNDVYLLNPTGEA